MIRIIDNTLTALDEHLPSKEELHSFCNLLCTIGVDIIELSTAAYEKMNYLPNDGNYMLNIEYLDEMDKYPGFYRYICRHDKILYNLMNEVQMNDAREIVKLRAFYDCKEVRIVGLDDLICGSYDKTFGEMKKILPKSKINFCPENTYGCASALAVQWLLNFGTDITSSFAGFKNNAATEEVIMAIRLAIRHKPNRDLSVLPIITKLFEHITQRVVSNKKPIIGRNIFKVEAGIHADGIKKNPSTYEAYDPCCVGGKSVIVIGKHSGVNAIKTKLEDMGVQIPSDEIVIKILDKVKTVATENRKSLKDEEFAKLAIEVIVNERKQIYR